MAQLPSAPAAARDATQAAARQDLDHGRNVEAIAILEKLAAANPHQKGLQHDLGVAYYRTGKLNEAKVAFAGAIADDPQDSESVQLEGLTLFRMGHPKAAIPYLEKVKQWTPNANADASHVLGLCYLDSQQFDEARVAFASEYHLDPNSGAAHLLLGRMLVIANLPDDGAAEAQKALQLSPALPMAHFLIGEVDLYKYQIDQAIAEFEAERKLNPMYAPVYDRLADAWIRTGKYDPAQEALLESIALDTSNTGPFILMGKVLLRKNDPQDAMLYLKHAEKMDPSNFITHTLLGQAYRGLGQEDAAKQELDTAAKIHAASELKLQPMQ